MLIVLVHLGCYNKIPQTGWLINNKHLFLTVLETGKSRIMALAGSVFAEGFLIHRRHVFTMSSHGRRGERELSGISFIYKDTNPIHESSAFMT